MSGGTPPEAVISVIGSGMKITGNVETDGAVRIDGSIKGDVRAGKAVVLGKSGVVEGNIFTQDAILSGRISGSVVEPLGCRRTGLGSIAKGYSIWAIPWGPRGFSRGGNTS